MYTKIFTYPILYSYEPKPGTCACVSMYTSPYIQNTTPHIAHSTSCYSRYVTHGICKRVGFHCIVHWSPHQHLAIATFTNHILSCALTFSLLWKNTKQHGQRLLEVKTAPWTGKTDSTGKPLKIVRLSPYHKLTLAFIAICLDCSLLFIMGLLQKIVWKTLKQLCLGKTRQSKLTTIHFFQPS